MRRLRLLFTALFAALATAGLAAFTTPHPTPPETVVLESASHSITIEYLDTRGDYRRAKVTLQPIRGGDRPQWDGEVHSFRLVGRGPMSREDAERFRAAGLSTAQILSSGHVGEVMVAPSRTTLLGLLILSGTTQKIAAFAIPGRVSGYDDDPSEDTDPPDTPEPQDPRPEPDPDTDDWCEESGYGDDCIGNPFEFTSRMTGNDRSVTFTF